MDKKSEITILSLSLKLIENKTWCTFYKVRVRIKIRVNVKC